MAVVKYQERGWGLIAIASFFLELCFRIRISRYVGDEKKRFIIKFLIPNEYFCTGYAISTIKTNPPQALPNMNTIDCIKTRRSVRKFKNEQIKDEELIQVLEAGTWSPTSMGAQHPHIIAVQNPAFLNRLRKMNAEVLGTTT